MQSSPETVPLHPRHADAVAALHMAGIPSGFITSLGSGFVSALYRAIASSEDGFGVVAEIEGRVVGFVAFASDLSRLYRSTARCGGCSMLLRLARAMLSPRRLVHVAQNLLYPSRAARLDLPRAELLALVVSPHARGKGIGSLLIRTGLEQCARRGATGVKVLVADANQPANRLYDRHGFVTVARIGSHGVPSNIRVVELD